MTLPVYHAKARLSEFLDRLLASTVNMGETLRRPLRATLVASKFAICLCALTGSISASTITLVYTQNINLGTSDLAGNPAIIWTATFDPSTDPDSPFTMISYTDNAAALADGVFVRATPQIEWGPAGQVDGILHALFGTPSYLYNSYYTYTSFPACQQPCSETATDQISYDQYVYPYPFFTPATYDSFSSGTVPEPGSLILIMLGGLPFILRRGLRKVLRWRQVAQV